MLLLRFKMYHLHEITDNINILNNFYYCFVYFLCDPYEFPQITIVKVASKFGILQWITFNLLVYFTFLVSVMF